MSGAAHEIMVRHPAIDVAGALRSLELDLEGDEARLVIGGVTGVARPLEGVVARRLGLAWHQRRRWGAQLDAGWVDVVDAGPSGTLLSVRLAAGGPDLAVRAAEALRRAVDRSLGVAPAAAEVPEVGAAVPAPDGRRLRRPATGTLGA